MKLKYYLCLALVLFTLPGTAMAMSGRYQPSWHDLYYKKTEIAKGWKYIIIHHSATDSGSTKAFHRYHSDQGYGGLCYHFVIGNGKGAPDGSVEEGFRWKDQMAGTHLDINSWYHNIFGIGICLVGNFEKNEPSEKQIKSLKELVKRLCKKYNIPKNNVLKHNQVPIGQMNWNAKGIKINYEKGKKAKTNCPGKKFPDIKKLFID